MGVLVAVGAIVLPAPAGAIVDVGGAVRPADTPAPALPDPLCLQSYADDAPRGGPALRLGIGPRLAGYVGTGQADGTAPENTRKRDAALLRLKGRRRLAVRLNRLFLADGDAGIAAFRRMAAHYGRLGLDVELQVRYHPTAARDGDLAHWLAFVDRVVRALGPNRHVTALQITNEVNIAFSPNTSDGAYRDAVAALTRGVVAAKARARAGGYRQLRIGFNYAYRFGAENDARFWDAVAAAGGPAFRRAVDWVGVDIYPGTYWPALGDVVDTGDALLEGIAQVRECYMPRAGLGARVPLRIEETGWSTDPPLRTEAAQAAALRGIVTTADAYRGTYGITDLRWFNLRDNTAAPGPVGAHLGLLRADYTPKPAFNVFRRLIARHGAR